MKTFNMAVNRQHSQEAEGAKKMRLKSGRRGRHLMAIRKQESPT